MQDTQDGGAAAAAGSADSDGELLARHVAGDTAAFGLLVHRHRDRLWAVALRTLGDREEAADALQDALISAFRAAHTFQGRSAVTTWLHRIVVNACLDRARRAASHRTRPLDEQPGLELALGQDEGADVSLERHELRRELALALDSLPVEQRAALVLVDMHGYPVAEAAQILNVPVGTVKSRCARGRARLLPRIAHLRSGPGIRGAQDTPAAQDTGVSRESGEPGRGSSTVPDSRETSENEPRGAAPPDPGNRKQGSSVPLVTARQPATDARPGGDPTT